MRERSSVIRIVALLIAFLMLSAMSGCPRPSNTNTGQDSGDMGGDTGGGMNGGGGMGGGGY
jgi:hypothetical protein